MTKTAQAFTAEERRQYIGASEIGAVMGLDKWRTPLDVYNEKLGLVEPFAGNQHTERGIRLEAIAAQMFTELTGRKLRRKGKNQELRHAEFPLVGHIDRIIEGENRLAEIKCPSVAAFRKYQRDGLPDSMLLQMQVYLGLSGFEYGEFIIFCADQMDIATFPVQFDDVIYITAVNAAREFWNSVQFEVPPTPLDADRPPIDFERLGVTVTTRDDDAFTEAALLLREADQIKRDGEELYELAKQKVLNAIEDTAGCYVGAGLRLSYTEQAGRKSFDKKLLAAEHPEIDLTKYEKAGAPFKTFRPFFINTGE